MTSDAIIAEIRKLPRAAQLGLLVVIGGMLAEMPTEPEPAAGAEELLTAKQVADVWNVPETWVRDQARAGKLPSFQLGRYVRFKRSDLERSLCRNGVHRV